MIKFFSLAFHDFFVPHCFKFNMFRQQDFCFSLFSKYFSESGKLVQKMFAEIRELIDDPNAFVCVLIDEVESLAAARYNNSFNSVASQ